MLLLQPRAWVFYPCIKQFIYPNMKVTIIIGFTTYPYNCAINFHLPREDKRGFGLFLGARTVQWWEHSPPTNVCGLITRLKFCWCEINIFGRTFIAFKSNNYLLHDLCEVSYQPHHPWKKVWSILWFHPTSWQPC